MLLRAYGRMLPRLEAEESILATKRGSAKLKNVQPIVREWERTANAGQARAVKVLPASIPGIGIVKVTKKA